MGTLRVSSNGEYMFELTGNREDVDNLKNVLSDALPAGTDIAAAARRAFIHAAAAGRPETDNPGIEKLLVAYYIITVTDADPESTTPVGERLEMHDLAVDLQYELGGIGIGIDITDSPIAAKPPIAAVARAPIAAGAKGTISVSTNGRHLFSWTGDASDIAKLEHDLSDGIPPGYTLTKVANEVVGLVVEKGGFTYEPEREKMAVIYSLANTPTQRSVLPGKIVEHLSTHDFAVDLRSAGKNRVAIHLEVSVVAAGTA